MRLTRYNHFDRTIWHDWFAWRPVYVKKYGWVWWETVQRRFYYAYDDGGREYQLKL